MIREKCAAVANLAEIGYNELTAFQRWRRANALRRIPSHEARGSGELWVSD